MDCRGSRRTAGRRRRNRAEAGSLDSVRVQQCAALGDRPQGGGGGCAVRQGGAERAIQHDRSDGTQDGWPRLQRAKAAANSGDHCVGGVAQRLELVVVDHPGGFDESGVDLGLGQRAVGRRPPDGGDGRRLRELEVEERRLVLLELRRGRQHVVGHPSGLGHEHVDDDDGVEGPIASRIRWLSAIE